MNIPTDSIIPFTACVLIASIIVGTRRYIRNKRVKEIKEVEDIHISELTKYWEKGLETGEIHIKNIAPIWKNNSIEPVQQLDREPFQNDDIERFFINFIENSSWFNNAFQHKEVCYNLLKLLDEEGDCPSVVNVSNDTEASWDTTTYKLLSSVTLTDHTLRVAEKTVEILDEKQLVFVIPDAMVTALGHDIGKLPSNKSNMYSLGEHPLAAGKVLTKVKSFKDLAKKDEITRAIKMHHRQGDGLLGKTVREADQKSRQLELDYACENTEVQVERTPKKDPLPAETADPKQKTKSSPARKAPNLDTGGSAVKAAQDIYGIESPAVKGGKNKVNITTWFDIGRFVRDLRPFINKIDKRVFTAFSMPNGYVYIQPGIIETVVKQIAADAGQIDIPTFSYKDKAMQNIMVAVVDYCRANDIIAESLIDPGYFGGYFNITTRKGKVFKGFYTPFLADPFGQIGELESLKTGMLKNFSSVNILDD